jgi:hypothetical protein
MAGGHDADGLPLAWLTPALQALTAIAGSTGLALASGNLPPFASGLVAGALAIVLISLCWCIARALSPRRRDGRRRSSRPVVTPSLEPEVSQGSES